MSDPVVRGRPEAAAVCLEVAPKPSAASLRAQGALRALLPLVLAAVFYATGHPVGAGIAGTLGALALLLALLSPTRGHLALVRALGWLGERVASVLGWLLLAPVFFFFVTPLALLTRRGAGDRLGMRFDRQSKTHWRTLPRLTGAERRRALSRPY
jgi:hypothetical protein